MGAPLVICSRTRCISLRVGRLFGTIWLLQLTALFLCQVGVPEEQPERTVIGGFEGASQDEGQSEQQE